jgi:hypothetical protein
MHSLGLSVLMLLAFFLTGCGGGGSSTDDSGSATNKAQIRLSLPAAPKSISTKTSLPRATATVPAEIDELRVILFTLLGDEVARRVIDAESGGTVSFSVDPLTDHSLVVEAYDTDCPPPELLYRGVAQVDRLVPGETRAVSVLMELQIRSQLVAEVSALPVGGLTTNYRLLLEGLNNANIRWLVEGVEGGSVTLGSLIDGLYTSPADLPDAPPVTLTIRGEPQCLPRFGQEAELTLLPLGTPPGSPVALDDAFEMNEDTQLMNNLLGNDFDSDGGTISLQTTPVSGPAHGAVALAANGDFTYTPALNYFGADTFVYSIIDNDGNTAQALVLIDVLPINDPPVAQDDYFALDSDEILSGNLLANNGSGRDSDPDNDVLEVTDVTPDGAVNGSISFLSDGSFEYTPSTSSGGYTDQFIYTLTDPGGETDTARVTIRVNEPPPALLAVNDDYSMRFGISSQEQELCGVVGNVMDNDTYPVGTVATLITPPGQDESGFPSGSDLEYFGDFMLYPDGTFIYWLPAWIWYEFSEVVTFTPDSFTYRLDNSGTLSNIATVTINRSCEVPFE